MICTLVKKKKICKDGRQIIFRTWNYIHNFAFTLIELLITVAIIGVLASLLLVSLSLAQESARSTYCKNNLKQMSLAWFLYTSDNEEKAPGNGYSSCGGVSKSPMWVVGYQNNSYCGLDYTNYNLLISPQYAQFSAYIKTPKIYKCPSDKKLFTHNVYGEEEARVDTIGPKVRSYSLNWNLGWDRGSGLDVVNMPKETNIIDKINQIKIPTQKLQFLDLHSESICWVWFGALKDKIIMYPAAYHNKKGNMSFTDGHIGDKKWKDSRTIQYNEIFFHNHGEQSPNNQDVNWLIDKLNQ
jgi:prepilin-type N-terminal cleavage/methylation domain-containing protein/prepilin-type processing-associated H-X9-DG protein